MELGGLYKAYAYKAGNFSRVICLIANTEDHIEPESIFRLIHTSWIVTAISTTISYWSMAKESIFLTGATGTSKSPKLEDGRLSANSALLIGYIGGCVLWRLLHHKNSATFDLKILVRSPEKAKIFKEKFGIDAVVGSHRDEDKLENLAAEADYVFAIVRKTTSWSGVLLMLARIIVQPRRMLMIFRRRKLF